LSRPNLEYDRKIVVSLGGPVCGALGRTASPISSSETGREFCSTRKGSMRDEKQIKKDEKVRTKMVANGGQKNWNYLQP
jgi:hypothetical protein